MTTYTVTFAPCIFCYREVHWFDGQWRDLGADTDRTNDDICPDLDPLLLGPGWGPQHQVDPTTIQRETA